MYTSIMQAVLVKGGPDTPLAQNTVFGWILVGRASSCISANPSVQGFHTCTHQLLNTTLPKFRELEEVPNDKPFTQDEEYCKECFSTTTTRNSDGCYVVWLPLKQTASTRDQKRSQWPTFFTNRGAGVEIQDWTTCTRSTCANTYASGTWSFPEKLSQDSYYVPHHAVSRHGSSEKYDSSSTLLNETKAKYHTDPSFKLILPQH